MKVVHVAVGVVINDRDEVLIAKRPDKVHQGGLWEFPGGKADPGETFDEALLREFFEETNIKVKIDCVLGHAQTEIEERHIAYLLILVQKVEGDLQISDEHDASAWVARSDFDQYEISPHFVPFSRTLPDALIKGVQDGQILS